MKVDVIHDVIVSTGTQSEDQACAYPLMALTADGAIVCMYRRGTEKHSYDGILVSQRSTDLGKTWSDPTMLFDGRALDPIQSASSGGICRCSDGTLVVVFCATEVTKPDTYVFSEEGSSQRTLLATARSLDGGVSWQACRYIDQEALGKELGPTANSILLADGTLFLPGERVQEHGQLGITGAFSLDHGQSISRVEDLIVDATGALNFCDGRFTMFPNRNLLAMLWTFRQSDEQTVEVHRSRSSDHGRTWSSPESVGHMGQITDPLAIDNDLVLAASNYRWSPEGIRLWTSRDAGMSWPVEDSVQMWDSKEQAIVAEVRPLRDHNSNQRVWNALPEFTFGTPNLKRLPDDTCLLTYYAEIDSKPNTRACRFRVDV